MQKSKAPTTRRRVSLSKHHSEIQGWVSQGYSDEWIAEVLGTSPSSVQSFRSRNKIGRQAGEASGEASDAATGETPPAGSGAAESVFEGVLEQGEDGYGLWLDPAVADDPLFRERFAGVSDVRVVLEPDRIILEPAPEQDSGQSTDLSSIFGGTPAANAAAGQPEIDPGAAWQTGHSAQAADSTGSEPGRVKFFDTDKGYGFIIRPDGAEIFFHRSEIRDAEELGSGEYVLFESGSSPRGPTAQRVRAVR